MIMRNKLTILIITTCLVLSTITLNSTGEQIIEDSEHWAIIIGVSKYASGGISNLWTPHMDAALLYNILLKDKSWNEDNIILLINETATKYNIFDALDSLRENADKDDIILFFFSGHGDHVIDKNGDEPDGMDEGLCPYNIKYNSTKEELINFCTDDELSEKFDNISKKNVKGMYLIFNACLSGGLIDWSNRKNIDLLTIKKTINIHGKKKNSFTTGLTTDISIDKRVIFASTTPHGLGLRGISTNDPEKWITPGRGICNALEKGKTTAEDISFYAKWWYLRQPEFLKMLFILFTLLLPLQIYFLINEGVMALPFPMWKDGYPTSNNPLHEKLFLF